MLGYYYDITLLSFENDLQIKLAELLVCSHSISIRRKNIVSALKSLYYFLSGYIALAKFQKGMFAEYNVHSRGDTNKHSIPLTPWKARERTGSVS